MAKPTRPTSALPSPPANRSTIRRGQPRKAKAPIITKPPSTNRSAGEEPALARNSRATAMIKAPSTRPTISGRTYCTLSAPCIPKAPVMSRRKQAMQKPMLAGLPKAVSSTAASPTAPPAKTTNQFTFFIETPLSQIYRKDTFIVSFFHKKANFSFRSKRHMIAQNDSSDLTGTFSNIINESLFHHGERRILSPGQIDLPEHALGIQVKGE